MIVARAVTLGICLFASPPAARAQLQALETEHLRLVYESATLSYLAPHVARCFENSLRFHRELFDYDPSEKITVILNDFADFGHAAATATPRNALLVSVAPMSLAYETYPSNERMNTMMNHELVHIAALDRAAGRERFFRALFQGKVQVTSDHPETIVYSYLTTPRRASPRWYHEGIAVFLETWMAGGLGRAQGPYDEMVFRSMVRDGSHFYDPLGLVSEGTRTDFQQEANSYLYGTRFQSYLVHRYSPESLIQWVARTDDTKSHYAAQFKRAYGMGLGEAWSDWIEWERQFQEENLASIRRYPTTPYRSVSTRPLGSVSRTLWDPENGKLYAALNYPGKLAHVAAISVEDGRIQSLRDVKGPDMHTVTSLAFDPAGGTLFYTTDNTAWRDLCALDPATGRHDILMKDVRVGDLAFNRADDSLWGVRHYNGISTLVRIPPPYDEWDQVYSWPYGEFLYDIDVSPDGRWLSTSVGEIDGRQSLRVLDLETLAAVDTTATASYAFSNNAIPSNFVFAPNGRYLYGSSYFSGVSNIFRYDAAADSMDAVTNGETGWFRPIPIGGDSLIAFRYTGEGFVPARLEALPLEDVSAVTFLGARIASEHQAVREWVAPSPLTVDLEAATTYSGPYRSWPNIGLASAVPIVEGYKDVPAYGLAFALSDPVFMNRIDLALSYSPDGRVGDDERAHIQLDYHRWNFTSFFTLNDADFYDLFGPTKRSRKGYAIGIQYRRILLYDEPRHWDLHFDLTRYWGLERLPNYQNVITSFGDMLSGSLRVGYRNLGFSLGAVDYEKGVQGNVAAHANLVEGMVFPSLQGDLDLGFPLPLHHSSLWLRGSAGLATQDRDEPLANFFFGGFGNNWVDHLEPKRYRKNYSFPGAELNEIAGTNYGRLLVEWNLPPLRFRRVGTADFYATWARLALFSAGLLTNLDHEESRRELATAGAQLDIRFKLLSNLNMTLSGGYAVAVEDGRRHGDEVMVSLKIL
jgi:hypothetical protein